LKRFINLKLPPVVSNEVKEYLSTRYARLLEYANYHAGLAHLDQQGGDVLNEVLLSLLGKDPAKLQGLYNRKKGGYRELDYFVLQMIKLNCHSETSPYRYKYKSGKRDENIETPETDQSDLSPFNEFWEENEPIEPTEEEYEESDPTELIWKRFEIVRDVLKNLNVPKREKEIFSHKFFAEESWSSWKGKEKPRMLNAVYKKVNQMIIQKIKRLRASYMGVIARSQKRIERVKDEYRWTLFPGQISNSKKYKRAIEVKTKYQSLLNQINGNHV